MGLFVNALTRLSTSSFNYWLGFMVDAAVAGWFLEHGLRTVQGTWASCGLIVLAGLGLYGFLEYLVHRWAYHDRRSPATTGHLLHHGDPQAAIALPFFVPATVICALWFLGRRILEEGEVSLMMAAVGSDFLYYELLHHSLHHWPLRARYFRTLRSHHLIHHHFSDRNFGVTTTLWDWVFGTHYLSPKRSHIRA